MIELNWKNPFWLRIRTALELNTKWFLAQWLELDRKRQRIKSMLLRHLGQLQTEHSSPCSKEHFGMPGCLYYLTVEGMQKDVHFVTHKLSFFL
jgi:hypothetical protein